MEVFHLRSKYNINFLIISVILFLFISLSCVDAAELNESVELKSDDMVLNEIDDSFGENNQSNIGIFDNSGGVYSEDPTDISNITAKVVVSPETSKVGDKVIVDLYIKNTVGRDLKTFYVCPIVKYGGESEYDYNNRLDYLGYSGDGFEDMPWGFNHVKTFKVNQTIHLRLFYNAKVPGNYNFSFYMGVYSSQHVWVNTSFKVINNAVFNEGIVFNKVNVNSNALSRYSCGNPVFILLSSLGLMFILRKH